MMLEVRVGAELKAGFAMRKVVQRLDPPLDHSRRFDERRVETTLREELQRSQTGALTKKKAGKKVNGGVTERRRE